MKERRISLRGNMWLARLCATVLQFLLYHSIACTVLGLFYDAEQPEQYRALLLLIVPIGYLLFVRHTVKKFVWFFLLHIPIFLSVVFFGRDFGEKVVIGVCTIVMTVISLHICMMEKGSVNECPSMKLCMILLGCYGISLYLGHPVCARYIYGEILLFIFLRLVHESLENTTDFIQINKSVENLPAGQMMIINRIMLVLFLAVMLAVMYIMPKLHLEIIVLPVIKCMLMLVTGLLTMIHLPEQAVQMEHIADTMKLSWKEDLLMNTGTAAVWIVLEEVLKVAVTVAVAAGLTGGMAYLLYRMYKGYYANRKENDDEREFLVREMKAELRFPGKFFGGRFGKAEEKESVNQRIRREYRRYIKKSFKKKEAVPEAFTPKELLAMAAGRRAKQGIRPEVQENIRRIYERARYGEEECTKEEAEEIRKLFL